MIRHWLLTKRQLIAELAHAHEQISEWIDELLDARGESARLTTEIEELRDQLLAARLLREGTKTLRAIDPRRPLSAAERTELLLLRHTHRELESRLAILQNANMKEDTHAV